LVFTGCRLGEALKLTTNDLNPKLGSSESSRRRRREYVRVIPIPSELFWRIVRNYLKTLPFHNTKLFNISNRQARNIVYTFSKRYLGERLRSHALRHSYATFILKKTRDLEAVRRLLGHADYKWLKCYLDYTQEDLEDILAEAFSTLS